MERTNNVYMYSFFAAMTIFVIAAFYFMGISLGIIALGVLAGGLILSIFLVAICRSLLTCDKLGSIIPDLETKSGFIKGAFLYVLCCAAYAALAFSDILEIFNWQSVCAYKC